jgi:hypothetical protein
MTSVRLILAALVLPAVLLAAAVAMITAITTARR